MGGESASQRKPQGIVYPVHAPQPVAKWISKIYKDRISQFTSPGQWQQNNLLAMMHDAVASGEPNVKLSVWSAPEQTRPTFEKVTAQTFKATRVGESFGPSWTTHWFRIEATLPDKMRGAELLEFHWDSGSEGMVWSEDGKPLQGLTGNGERIEWAWPDAWRDDETHVFYVEMACNGMFGNTDGIAPPDPNRFFRLAQAAIVAVNKDARQLRIDMWIIGDAAREFPEDWWEQHKALKLCQEILNTFELGDKASLKRCREMARQYVGEKVDSDEVYKTGEEPLVYGIGHCHIDTCWLWPWAETKRKVARSWSNQCNLMDKYGELRFACSQAQQFQWLKQHYPYVFDRVKQKVKEGRFNPIGGSWVEHDTNMPSGESLVRQFLYGQRFFESNFGERCTTFWLPDTFGYAAQLPQICRQAGMTRFLTQKLSWNNINTFPHTTFNWVALDGSQVICHMPPAETYTSEAHFGDVCRSVSQHKSLDQDPTSLLVFGKGDGGGGPTWEHMEKLRRCRGISDTVGKLPRVHLGSTVDDFFDKLERKGASLVTWYGELYFELHRGTYTTQANNKSNNRKAEFLLRDVEWLATLASLVNPAYKYPKEQMDDMWEGTLLCQFHDCLPGSAIEMCYDDSDKLYAQIFATAARVMDDIHTALGLTTLSGAERRPQDVRAVNTLPWPRAEFFDLAPNVKALAHGQGPFLAVSPLPSPGPPLTGPRVQAEEMSDGVFVLDNGALRVHIEAGCIVSLYDKASRREVIPQGQKAIQYVIFDDKPLYWQAWDVEVYHLHTRKELAGGKTRLAEANDHVASVVTKTRISDKSWIETTISLQALTRSDALPTTGWGPACVEVSSLVEWHETMKFLKVEVPVAVRSTEASYESAYGIVRRPTHYNTTWDMAKFEVCCHKWVDLSEQNYGVSVLNDCKYGFATAGNVMRLSLLRSPKAPDAHADMGRHTMRWAVMPHRGPVGPQTVRRAYELNNPMRVVGGARIDEPLVELVGDEGIVLDVIKRGEDDEDVSRGDLPTRKGRRSIVLRVYESMGGTRTARAVLGQFAPVRRVLRVNALEDEVGAQEVAVDRAVFISSRDSYRDAFEIGLGPFEVATFKLLLGSVEEMRTEES